MGATRPTIAIDNREVTLTFAELAELREEANAQRARADELDRRLAALRDQAAIYRLISYLHHKSEQAKRHNQAGWREAITEARIFAASLEEHAAL